MTWDLPESATFSGVEYSHRTDFRDILKLLALLSDETKPALFRWQTALFYFYGTDIPPENHREAMDYLGDFLSAGEAGSPGPRRFDWQADAQAIAAGVNAVAGFEVRQAKHLHWWTFLGYFRSMGEGQFSFLVGIREKLRKGQKLDPQEQEFYRTHRAQVQLKSPDTEEKRRLEALLAGM